MAESPTYEELQQKIEKLEKEVRMYRQTEKSMNVFKMFAESSSQGLGMAGFDGIITYINPALCTIVGEGSPEDTYGKHISFYYPEKVRKRVENEIVPVALEKGSWMGELPFQTVSGKLIPTIQSIFFVRDKEGAPFCLANLITDITELKKTEKKIGQSEAKYRLLADNVNDVIFVLDIDSMRFSYVSPSVKKIAGYTPEEIIEMEVHERLTPASYEYIKSVLNEELEKEKDGIADPDRTRVLEIQEYYKDGSVKWIEMKVGFLRDDKGKVVSILGISRDIDERKMMEVALLESEEKFRLISENSSQGIFIIQDNFIIYANNAASLITGYTADELYAWGKEGMIKHTHPDDVEFVIEQIRKKQEGASDFVHHYEFRLISKSGEIKWIDIYSAVIMFRGKHASLSTHIDITERKRTEEALKASEEKARVLLNATEYMIVLLDREDNILDLNKKAAEKIGLSIEALTNKNIFEFVDEKLVEKRKEGFSEAVRTGRPVFFEVENEGVIYNNSLYPIPDSQGNVTSIAVHSKDITRDKQIQAQLIRYKSLASTGQLAASVAHEINSPLQGIISLLSMIKNNYKDDPELIENIDLLQIAFDSIRDTVKNLLDLNRPHREEKQPADLNQIIENTLSLIRIHLKHQKVKVSLDLSRDIPIIEVSPQQIGQVLVNLINNSVEVISEIFQTSETSASRSSVKGEIFIRTYFKDRNINIEVADSGPGIPVEDHERIFDPFFTKKKKMGIGIGLFICSSIIQDHDGTVQVKNSETGGAVFTIKLPVK